MPNAPDIASLSAYGGKYQKGLISTAVNGMDIAKDIRVLPNIKNKIYFTKLTAGKGARPYRSTFDGGAAGDLQYSGRTLEVMLGKRDLLIEPLQYRETWMSEVMKPGVNKNDIPFEAYVWNQVMLELAAEINDDAAYLGVHNAAGANAAAITTGLGTLIANEITGLALVPETIGAIAAGTAVAQFESMFKSLAVPYRKMGTNIYCSYDSWDMYCEDYRSKFGNNLDYDKFGNPVIKHSQGKCIIKPASWMGDSGRLICTPFDNLILGTDLLSDLNKINRVEDVWTLKVGIAFALGFQIRDLAAIKVSDVA